MMKRAVANFINMHSDITFNGIKLVDMLNQSHIHFIDNIVLSDEINPGHHSGTILQIISLLIRMNILLNQIAENVYIYIYICSLYIYIREL